MQKRRIIIDNYNTAEHGWTLTGWTFSRAEQKTKYLAKPNGDGTWDLSTVNTDGIPRYGDRALTASLELSEGTRKEREQVISDMINSLDGARVQIKLPDDDLHYIVGRVHVSREYNDLAHAAVTVSAECEPWLYANSETVVVLACTDVQQTMVLYNGGRRAVVPTLQVDGDSVLLEYGVASMALATGEHQWPSLLLTPGGHAVTYSGSGTVTVRYREAVLA